MGISNYIAKAREFSKSRNSSGIERRLYSTIKKGSLLGAAAIAAASYFPNSVMAEVINVDPTWSYTEINAILDNDPLTFGKDGQTDAQPGDTLHFAAGTYQLPLQQGGAEFKIYVSGTPTQPIILESNLDAILKGSFGPQGGAVFRVKSASNITFRNLDIQNAFVGVAIEDNYSNITLEGNNFTNSLSKAIIWENQYNAEGNAQASVTLDGNIISSVIVGFNFDKMDIPTTAETRYVDALNNTFDNISGLGGDPPFIVNTAYRGGNGLEGDCEEGQVTILGNFAGNIFQNSPGASFQEILYCGWPINPLLELETIPEENGEWSMQAGESFFSRGIGQTNFEADPMLDAYFRPAMNSPAIGPQFNGGQGGVAGARGPAGDSNRDGRLDLKDFSYLQRSFTGDQIPAKEINKIKMDFDFDADIDEADLEMFTANMTGPSWSTE
ncbi:hypothetical protein HY450_02785 [Candidatus Pacearchaeota archaeon]|nr:hypothetical protein [Candidatus Pacearchaeota archaeon]